jgi:DNA-directed RNA polymerase specialized sigma24 family protein
MEDFNILRISAEDSDPEDEIIGQHDAYIRAVAHQKMPRHIIPPETLDMEIDDLVQNIRIKLWFALQRSEISNPRAYIRRIAETTAMDIVRRYRLLLPLPVDDDGELYQGSVMLLPSEGMRDPAYEFECTEVPVKRAQEVADAILDLPPAQRRAMICSLKEQINDATSLIKELQRRAVPLEAFDWPPEEDFKHSLKVSLSVARKKLHFLYDSEE